MLHAKNTFPRHSPFSSRAHAAASRLPSEATSRSKLSVVDGIADLGELLLVPRGWPPLVFQPKHDDIGGIVNQLGPQSQ